jgi:hypothetical protein
MTGLMTGLVRRQGWNDKMNLKQSLGTSYVPQQGSHLIEYSGQLSVCFQVGEAYPHNDFAETVHEWHSGKALYQISLVT